MDDRDSDEALSIVWLEEGEETYKGLDSLYLPRGENFISKRQAKHGNQSNSIILEETVFDIEHLHNLISYSRPDVTKPATPLSKKSRPEVALSG